MCKFKKVADQHPPPEHHITYLAAHGDLLLPEDNFLCGLPQNQIVEINPEEKQEPREHAGIKIAWEVGKEEAK